MKRANGTGNIVFLGKNRRKPWAVRVSEWVIAPDGGRIRKRRIIGVYATRKEAQKQINGLVDGTLVSDQTKKIKLRECIDAAMERIRMVSAENTINAYLGGTRYLQPFLDLPIAGITGETWQNFFDQMCDSGKSRSTINHTLSILRHAIKVAIRRGALASDPTAAVQIGKRIRAVPQKRRPFTHDEITKLWNNTHDEMAKTVLIMIYTGLRVGEYLALTSDNYRNGCLYVAESKTSAGIRVVPVADCISSFVADRMKNGILPEEKTNDGNFRYHFETYLAHIEMKHIPHETRHTFATLLDEARLPNGDRVDLSVAKVLIGHRVSDITKGTYTHENFPRLVAAVNALKTSWD